MQGSTSSEAPTSAASQVPASESEANASPWVSRRRVIGIAASVLLGAWLLLLPTMGASPALRGAVLITVIFVPAALGQNLIVGNAGLLSIGQAAFMGVGAYASGILAVRYGVDGAVSFVAAVLASGAAGLVVGIPALRLRGDYLLIVSLGFNLMFIDIVVNWIGVTGGASGLVGIPPLTVFGFDVGTGTPFYYVALAVAGAACLATWVIGRSRFGKTVEALRDDMPAALSVGIRPDHPRIAIFGLGSALAGMSGWLLAANLMFVGPPSFQVLVSVMLFLTAVVGGLGRVAGSIVGVVIIIFVPEMLRPLQDFRDLIGGGLVILLMILRPQGLFGKTMIVNLIKK